MILSPINQIRLDQFHEIATSQSSRSSKSMCPIAFYKYRDMWSPENGKQSTGSSFRFIAAIWVRPKCEFWKASEIDEACEYTPMGSFNYMLSLLNEHFAAELHHDPPLRMNSIEFQGCEKSSMNSCVRLAENRFRVSTIVSALIQHNPYHSRSPAERNVQQI